MDFKHNLLAIAIAIVLAFFVGYGIEVFSDSPEYQDFCPNLYDIADEVACTNTGGVWNANQVQKGERGWCVNKIDCNKPFQNAQEKHDKVVFIVSLVAGIIAIIGGMNLKHDVINRGLLLGGVLLLLYGTIRYWSHANDILKFVLLGIALVILVWIGYKKLK